jgi:methionyl-tRNA synthetase
MINPFMPHTAAKIWVQLGLEEGESTSWDSANEFGITKEKTVVKKADPLFPRIDVKKELEALSAERAEKEQESEVETYKPQITFDDFEKLDLRVAEIIKVEKHPKADKLLVLQLKLGSDRRQIVAGIAKDFTFEELLGKKIVIIANLKPVKLRGIESNGMLLAADDSDGMGLLTVDVADGSLVG